VLQEVLTVTWLTEKMCMLQVMPLSLHAVCIESLCELTVRVADGIAASSAPRAVRRGDGADARWHAPGSR
jgi:hypothetical protein